MGRFHGSDGIVEVDSNAVLEVTEFTMDVARGVSRAPSMGASYVGHAVGKPAYSGRIRGQFDPGDTTGQEVLRTAASVALVLQPEGVGAGKAQWSFSKAVISDLSYSIPTEGYATAEFAWYADSDLDDTAQV